MCFDKVYLVYKILDSPLDLLVSGLQQMPQQEANHYFKQCAKQLHPDKNQHP
jgi:hypothetical protein